MITKIISGTVIGVDGIIVTVEVDLSNGMPAMDIVGLPDSAVKESKERVKSAIKNSGFIFPNKKITINLAPADMKKEGPSFDLPIAVGILTCMGMIDPAKIQDSLFIGELSLDGEIKEVNGVLPVIHNAASESIKNCIVPIKNIDEAALIKNINIFGVKDLLQLIDHFKNKPLTPHKIDFNSLPQHDDDFGDLDYSQVKGQEAIKRAILIAAAGFHNMLMIGHPGSGKTMMAKRIPTILPNLSFEESIDITKIYSVYGSLKHSNHLVQKRPFCAPHHNISASALSGGGKYPRPGEISLAHNGVLFLDELLEFNKNVLEVLRQPLEDGYINISRVNGTITYPAKFMLVTSMNPCPCGYLGDHTKCKCSEQQINKYLGKLSGPLLDRIDIHTEAAKVNFDDFQASTKSLSSKEMKISVENAQALQLKRYEGKNFRFNSQLPPSLIDEYCKLDQESLDLVRAFFNEMGLSARAYHKILKISRTIADLENSQNIKIEHVAEALQYRRLDTKFWSNSR